MQTKKQAGFTLIELMIVVAIVGILAAVAIPAYQDYIKRSKISEVMAAAAACKTSVAEYYSSRAALPATVADAGCSTTPSQYAGAITVANGIITVPIQASVGAGTGDIVLSPSTATDGVTITAPDPTAGDEIVSWVCTTTLTETKYVPASCR